MRILLRNVLTRLYVAESGGWVEAHTEARDFARSLAAMQFAQALGGKDLEVVFNFGAPQFDLVVPLETSFPRGSQSPSGQALG